MNKKALTIFMFISLLIGSASIVLAQGEEGVFSEIGKFIMELVRGQYGFHFLLWITLFAVINFGLKKAKFDAKVSGVISLALSAGSVFLIPERVIKSIFVTYSVLIIYGLGVFVPILLLWIVHKNFEGDDLGHHLLRAVTYFIVGYALWNFSQYIGLEEILVNLGGPVQEKLLAATKWVYTIAVFFIIAGIYNLITSFEFGKGAMEKVGESIGKKSPEATEKAKNALSKGYERAKKSVSNIFVGEKKELKLIKKIEKSHEDFTKTVEAILKKGKINGKDSKELVNKVDGLLEKIEKTKNYFRKRIKRATWREESGMKKVIKQLKALGKDTSELEILEKDILKLHKSIHGELETIYDLINNEVKNKKIKIVKNFIENLNNIPSEGVDLSVGIRGGPTLKEILEGLSNDLKDITEFFEEMHDKEDKLMTELEGILAKADKEIKETEE